MRLLIYNLNSGSISSEIETWLKQKASLALQQSNPTKVIEGVKSRDLRIQALLQRTPFEELGLQRPLTDSEKADQAAKEAKLKAKEDKVKYKAEKAEARAKRAAEKAAKA